MQDNGIGIAPEDQPKIFGAFQRLHGKGVYPGTGLGLAIVRKGAERMGGRVGLESEPGQGSRFWLELGRAQRAPSRADGVLGGHSCSWRCRGLQCGWKGVIMNKYLVECIGTFFLVLTVGCSVIIGGAGVIAPLAIGSALMVMVYAGGHISGGHYNPAVTLGVWVRGRCPTADLLPYWVAQLVGAALAALAVNYLKGPATVTPMALHPGPALLAEFLFTFALVYVVLNCATVDSQAGNSFYGLAIGFTVLIGAFAVGSITSAAFNPAVALGISMLGLSSWSNLWIYFLANLAGGLVAGLVFNLLHREAKRPSPLLPQAAPGLRPSHQ